MSELKGWLSLVGHPIVDLFINVPEFKYRLMGYLSASHMSMFVASFNLLTLDTDREKFMNPIRNLGDKHEDI